ncbi:MAG: hypothetical protein Q9160_004932 [Pyrenula sp. 1 TL-2023]
MGINNDAGEEQDNADNATELANGHVRRQSSKLTDTETDEFGLSKKLVSDKPSPSHSGRTSVSTDDDPKLDTFHDAEDRVAEEENQYTAIDEADSRDTKQGRSQGPQTTQLNGSTPRNMQKRDAEQLPSKDRETKLQPMTVLEHVQQPSAIEGAPDDSTKAHPSEESQLRDTALDRVSNRPSTPPHNNTENSNKSTPTSKVNGRSSGGAAVSEWSHQRLAPHEQEIDEKEDEGDWQAMPAIAEYDLYDDDGRQIAKAADLENEDAIYSGLGGAGKGYTKVQLDEDAQSATSMDDNTQYLFKQEKVNEEDDDDEDQRDHKSQLEATKDLLTEGQRIAYVGVARLTFYNMANELEKIEPTKGTKKNFNQALESMRKWGQQMMVRLYAHMDIDSAEQLMIEQLAEHGVQPVDLVPPIMNTARVKNPMADEETRDDPGNKKHSPSMSEKASQSSGSSMFETNLRSPSLKDVTNEQDVPEVHTPSKMEHTEKIDLDLRWTILCDLFLTLIADSTYDSRSRLLLEKVAAAMEISWVQICRFEKRVIDALEMQEEANNESWNEEENMEKRRKMALKRKYMVMGLATVGGGLVIGLSAGLLAPVIGAGFAAGFTTIGVTGTAGFFGGIGGAALITSAGVATGGTIAVRASHRRTGAVKTFEYRPLHNNKRLNLIVTISGWMNGKVDDVRLPYSTVDPIMGDMYSLYWEPEMLQSMGDTINILATEALTQTVQQVLGSTILVALMASLQLPIVLTKLSYLIDNPWTVSLDRANSAGLILADSLISRHLGQRPITLVGFSLGSRVIFSCLRELASRNAYGLIQNVYLFGSPIVAKKDEYLRARTVVSGRFVNGYASNDWILGYLFRATSGGIMRVAGLAPVEEISGLENVDVTKLVNGHMAYRAAMPKLLREVGWEVESDEFTEIEDPDPENHAKRQRELIREIEEGRKEAEVTSGKMRFNFFKKGKLTEKKRWETYNEDNMARRNSEDGKNSFEGDGFGNGNILFDVEAIKKELESEMIEVKQLESTLPPMKVNLNSEADPKETRPSLRQTQSETIKLNLPLPPSEADDAYNGMPRELSTTLPPLRLSMESREPILPHSQSPSTTDVTTRSVTPSPQPSRPELKTSTTMPVSLPHYDDATKEPPPSSPRPKLEFVPASPVGLVRSPVVEHNAWANGGEDDPEEWGQEREVKMTF